MELSALAQVGTMVLAALAIVWHQQKSNDRLRDDLRGELGTLRLIVTENGQRLARIEGYLGIGMPSEAATAAAGAEAPRTTQGPNG
ncbi:hypothetical protein [Candidatus Poriferisodalis sp.]|uniref:hypothetical protein n=1 Tax=Candidatus Poriferisodalis sp. TaxID=3101277 RepID=UPI003B527F1D